MRIPRNDAVICPKCVHEFYAICVDDQAYRSKLETALSGILGLVQLLSRNEDIPAAIRARMTENHRFKDAQACFPETDWSEYGLTAPETKCKWCNGTYEEVRDNICGPCRCLAVADSL